MNYFSKSTNTLKFALPSTKLAVLGVCTLAITGVTKLLSVLLALMPSNYFITAEMLNNAVRTINKATILLFIIFIIISLSAILSRVLMKDEAKITHMVKKALFSYYLGNPLHLQEGERLPKVRCRKVFSGVYEITITAISSTVEDLQKVSSSISSSLNKKFNRFAVTQTSSDLAFNSVSFCIEDVLVDKSLTFYSIEEMKSKEPTKLKVQKGTRIDLTTSGSMLVAGKTRSGKTTGIISLLLQVLLSGRDNYGSECIIIDPKRAELSCLPHVYTVDDNGEAKSILEAVKIFENSIAKRQKILNDLSTQKGDVIKWWEAYFHPSFLFIDEYVALRSLFPTKPSKDDPEYCLATFDGLLKRIVTMGASAGCFAIISIAEASVQEGGLPAMLRSAMSTKILFKPTPDEARLMWDSEKLKDLNSSRVYNAGDAWFSSTDGINDFVNYVHFPLMNFKVYAELGRLLSEYYCN